MQGLNVNKRFLISTSLTSDILKHVPGSILRTGRFKSTCYENSLLIKVPGKGQLKGQPDPKIMRIPPARSYTPGIRVIDQWLVPYNETPVRPSSTLLGG